MEINMKKRRFKKTVRVPFFVSKKKGFKKKPGSAPRETRQTPVYIAPPEEQPTPN
jgi:hypothetical protein